MRDANDAQTSRSDRCCLLGRAVSLSCRSASKARPAASRTGLTAWCVATSQAASRGRRRGATASRAQSDAASAATRSNAAARSFHASWPTISRDALPAPSTQRAACRASAGAAALSPSANAASACATTRGSNCDVDIFASRRESSLRRRSAAAASQNGSRASAWLRQASTTHEHTGALPGATASAKAARCVVVSATATSSGPSDTRQPGGRTSGRCRLTLRSRAWPSSSQWTTTPQFWGSAVTAPGNATPRMAHRRLRSSNKPWGVARRSLESASNQTFRGPGSDRSTAARQCATARRPLACGRASTSVKGAIRTSTGNVMASSGPTFCRDAAARGKMSRAMPPATTAAHCDRACRNFRTLSDVRAGPQSMRETRRAGVRSRLRQRAYQQ